MEKNRNKKSAAVMLTVMAVMAALFTGCGVRTDETVVARESETPLPETGGAMVCGCTCACQDCICAGTGTAGNNAAAAALETEPQAASEIKQEDSTDTQTAEASESVTSAESETGQEAEQQETSELSEIERLSEGELKARKEQQTNLAGARAMLYGLKNSKDKTTRINQMDRQLLANNAYDFSKKNIVFIGDSITEGIASAVDVNGSFISYVTYADSYLHFKRTLNHGAGGRMFSVYGDESLSLAMNFGNVTNVDSDIIVVFAGVNDYLSTPANKRFGDVNDKLSIAGYCGAVRLFMKQLQEYYSDREIFFVTMYDIDKKVECAYSDIKGQPALNDYMEVQRKLAKEYGFHIIELYDIGFMDCSDKESADFYLRDGLHPKDNGNIVLGEHIAAELSLYFGQK